MGVFFASWELWQEMTFILACLIAVVFVTGFVKLWRTNQILRRYELLDEEKRARMSEMQKYGIDIPAVNEIPFGSRAIQSGIEVDEIWISRPNTPAISQRASCATVIDDSSVDGTIPSRRAFSYPQPADHGNLSKAPERSNAAHSRPTKRSGLSEQHFSEATTLGGPSCDDSLPESKSESFGKQQGSADAKVQRRWSSVQSAADAAGPTMAMMTSSSPDSDAPIEPVAYGNAEIFVNTRTRKTDSGFEILPAGSLGERFELKDASRESEEVQPQRPDGTQRIPNKLQKSRPRKP